MLLRNCPGCLRQNPKRTNDVMVSPFLLCWKKSSSLSNQRKRWKRILCWLRHSSWTMRRLPGGHHTGWWEFLSGHVAFCCKSRWRCRRRLGNVLPLLRRKKVLRVSDVLALGRGLRSDTSHQRNATPWTIASGNSREWKQLGLKHVHKKGALKNFALRCFHYLDLTWNTTILIVMSVMSCFFIVGSWSSCHDFRESQPEDESFKASMVPRPGLLVEFIL